MTFKLNSTEIQLSNPICRLLFCSIESFKTFLNLSLVHTLHTHNSTTLSFINYVYDLRHLPVQNKRSKRLTNRFFWFQINNKCAVHRIYIYSWFTINCLIKWMIKWYNRLGLWGWTAFHGWICIWCMMGIMPPNKFTRKLGIDVQRMWKKLFSIEYRLDFRASNLKSFTWIPLIHSCEVNILLK